MTSDKVLIGKIVNAHGIKGDVKVKSFTMNPADVCSYTPLLKSDDSELKIKLRSAGNSDVIIAHIDGVNDRTTAEGLKGTEIFTLKSSIIDEDSDEILLSDLIGFKILNNNSKEIGEVVDILNYGAGDILEIQLYGREKTALLSYNENSIIDQNNEQGTLKIDTEHLLAD
ncbi:MAG: 16S rRNA processing protein RimM [Alphaproteobacteria bacterium]|nr:16S rRNA processing protein RimM [Alphaproteobacteria bacterium]